MRTHFKMNGWELPKELKKILISLKVAATLSHFRIEMKRLGQNVEPGLKSRKHPKLIQFE